MSCNVAASPLPSWRMSCAVSVPIQPQHQYIFGTPIPSNTIPLNVSADTSERSADTLERSADTLQEPADKKFVKTNRRVQNGRAERTSTGARLALYIPGQSFLYIIVSSTVGSCATAVGPIRTCSCLSRTFFSLVHVHVYVNKSRQ